MTGVAAGLAASGKTPFACGFAKFVTGRAWEQIANSIARPKMNVKIVGTHSGLSGSADGDSHQTVGDIALMRVLPNMNVVVPADAPSVEEATRAIAEEPGPAYMRLVRGASPAVYDGGCTFTLGKANLLREGSDATVIACGVMVAMAQAVAEDLAAQGVSVRVLDMHTVKPLDVSSVVKAARETGAVVTAEEHSILGGLGGAVAETLVEAYPIPVNRVGILDRFGDSSRSYSELQEAMGLTPRAIAGAVMTLMEKRR
jgi:transketolase